MMDPPPPPPPPTNPPDQPSGKSNSPSDYAPYPKIDPNDLEAPPLDTSRSTTTIPVDSNPYVAPATAGPSPKFSVNAVRNVLGKWGKSVGEAARSTEELAGNFWQHLKTGPSFADAAMGVITEGTKVIAEGGYEKIFRKTFETLPEEQLKQTYTCFLSTSAGPVRGVLYLSSTKLAFSSDNPLSYKVGDKTEWSYYKVQSKRRCNLDPERLNKLVFIKYNKALKERFDRRRSLNNPEDFDPIALDDLNYTSEWMTGHAGASNEFVYGEEGLTWAEVVIPLNQLRTVNPSTSKINPAEKYIQIVSVDDHEFWFMGFVNYENAVKCLQEFLLVQDLQQ